MNINYKAMVRVMLMLSVMAQTTSLYADYSLSKLFKEKAKKREPLWFDVLTNERKEREKKQEIQKIESALNQNIPQDIAQQRTQVGNIQCLTQPQLNLNEQLSLIHAVERSVCRFPETKAAWVKTKIQAAQLRITQSSYYPQVSASLNYDWGRDDYQVDGRPDMSYDTDTRRYGLAVQANWLIYDFGARHYQVEEAQTLLAMSLAQQDVVLQNVMIKTISAYYHIIQLELKLDNLKQIVLLAEQNYKIANARYKAGAGIKSDELQMFANLAKVQSEQTKLIGDLNIAKGQLAAIMGEPAYQSFQIDNQLKIPTSLNLKSIEDLIKDAAELHPRFKAARLNIQVAEHKIKATQSARYPSLTFNSGLNQSKQLGESPFGNESQGLQAGIQLNFPLFDGFNRKNQIVIAQENLKLRQLEEEQLKLEINTEIWKSYNELNAIHENIKALQLLNHSAATAYEVVQGRYRAGVGSMLEVLNAQNLLTEAKLNYSTVLTEFLIVRYQLLSNMGNLNIWSETQVK